MPHPVPVTVLLDILERIALVSSSMIHACFIVKCDLTLEFGIKIPSVVALQVENILLFLCPASQYKLNLTHMHIIYSAEI